jgi:hypothetical protein
MSAFQIHGIADSVAAEVRDTMRAPQYGHPAHREIAQGTGPCRQCLRTFAVGCDERILFTYQPFDEPGSLPSPGPVFIHADACERYESGALPQDWRELPLVFEAYETGGRLIARRRCAPGATDAEVEDLFEQTRASYIHVRNGEAGCFMARVIREASTAESPSYSASARSRPESARSPSSS